MFLIQFNVLNCGLLSSQVASHHNFHRISLQSSTDFKQVVLYVRKFSSIMDMSCQWVCVCWWELTWATYRIIIRRNGNSGFLILNMRYSDIFWIGSCKKFHANVLFTRQFKFISLFKNCAWLQQFYALTESFIVHTKPSGGFQNWF